MIREFAQTFELTFQLKQPLRQLSSGQIQKAFLMKGLINRPDIFIMDEPFSHLDPHTRQDILKDLFWFLKNKETTILWASHDKEEVFKFADKIGILQHGRFEQIDTALNLNKNPNNLFVAKYLGYKNFFPVKNTSEGFQSMWGIAPYDLKWDEAFLVVPEKSWKIDSNGINFKIEHYQVLGSHVELELLSGDKIYYIHLPIHLPMPKVSSLIKLSPKWEECFLIPL
jgi:ABC-type sugar transport system ATPase subunit